MTVLKGLRDVLDRLRGTLSDKAEQAYEDRDTRSATESERAYASGEAHAYGVAADDVRKARDDEEEKEEEAADAGP